MSLRSSPPATFSRRLPHPHSGTAHSPQWAPVLDAPTSCCLEGVAATRGGRCCTPPRTHTHRSGHQLRGGQAVRPLPSTHSTGGAFLRLNPGLTLRVSPSAPTPPSEGHPTPQATPDRLHGTRPRSDSSVLAHRPRQHRPRQHRVPGGSDPTGAGPPCTQTHSEAAPPPQAFLAPSLSWAGGTETESPCWA